MKKWVNSLNKLPMEITLFENLPILFLNSKIVSKKEKHYLSLGQTEKNQTQKTRRLYPVIEFFHKKRLSMCFGNHRRPDRHPGSLPGGREMNVKLVFADRSGIILVSGFSFLSGVWS